MVTCTVHLSITNKQWWKGLGVGEMEHTGNNVETYLLQESLGISPEGVKLVMRGKIVNFISLIDRQVCISNINFCNIVEITFRS